MAKKPLFKIDPGSEVKGTGRGDILVTCTPDHPHGEKRPEHNKRYIYKHIAVMELHLGRYLRPDEEVHHRDGNPSNNKLSNLKLTKRGKHQRDHALTDNPFWKKSPENKPNKKSKKAMAQRVVSAYLTIL
jgi:hypothetical protein